MKYLLSAMIILLATTVCDAQGYGTKLGTRTYRYRNYSSSPGRYLYYSQPIRRTYYSVPTGRWSYGGYRSYNYGK